MVKLFVPYDQEVMDLIRNDYLLDMIKENRISLSQQNLRINAIKFYYEKVLKREKADYDIDRPPRLISLNLRIRWKFSIWTAVDTCSYIADLV